MEVIVVSGTPGTGKTFVSKKIAKKLKFYYLDVNKAVSKYTLLEGYDKKRKTMIVDTKKLNKFLAKENFGPEALEKNFTLDLFKRLLAKKPKAKIKPLLMDQTFIAGLGNIYSDEVLFFAGVLPFRRASSLKPEEIKKIYQSIRKILPQAVKRQGTSVDMYLTAEGKEGGYASLLKVYDRCDEPCFACRTKIKRLKLGGRSAHFCTKCQK